MLFFLQSEHLCPGGIAENCILKRTSEEFIVFNQLLRKVELNVGTKIIDFLALSGFLDMIDPILCDHLMSLMGRFNSKNYITCELIKRDVVYLILWHNKLNNMNFRN